MIKISEAKTLGNAGSAKLQEMSANTDVYTDFLKFQGRVFKQKADIAVEFFAQKPETEFIATSEQWAAAGYRIKNGGSAIHFTDENGNSSNLFDFSQVEGDTPPKIWTINAENISAIKTALKIPENTKLIKGITTSTLNNSQIVDCMAVLGIPPKDFESFRKCYIDAVQTILAGRLEIGGKKFSVKPDLTAFKALQSEPQKVGFLTLVGNTAREMLFRVEKIANEIITKQQAERITGEQNDLSRMEQADGRTATERTGERTADDSQRGTGEQTNPVENAHQGRGAGLGSTDRGESADGTVQGVQTGERVGADDVVQIQPPLGNIRNESDGLRAVNDGRTNRELRNEVDRVDERESPNESSGNEVQENLSDGGKVGGREGMGLSGATRKPVPTAEPPSEGIRGSSSVGNDKKILHGQHGNDGGSVSTNNSTLNKLNSVLETPIKPETEIGVSRLRGKKFDPNQLTLFGDSDIEEQEPQKVVNEPVPQAVIDNILAHGGNDNDSVLRIIAQFQKRKSTEENAVFLENEMRKKIGGHTGRGHIIDGRKYAASFYYDGIEISAGDSSKSPRSVTVSWEQAAKRISELLEQGTFAAQENLNKAWDYEIKDCANQIWYLSKDCEDGEGFLPENIMHNNFPKQTAEFAEFAEFLKNDAEFTQQIISNLTDFAARYEQDRDILRFRTYNPHELLENIKDLQHEPAVFMASDNFVLQSKLFITEDEKQHLVLSGNHINISKFDIDDFFRENNDPKAQEKFIKSNYSQHSGSHTSGYDSESRAKGLILTRSYQQMFGHDVYAYEKYDEVALPWKDVAYRINTAVNEGRYITGKERVKQLRAELLHTSNTATGKTEYFLFHNPKKADSPVWLNHDNLALLNEHIKANGKADKYVICADVAAMSREFMKEHNIVFRKTSRDWEKLPVKVRERINEIDPQYEKDWLKSTEFQREFEEWKKTQNAEETETPIEQKRQLEESETPIEQKRQPEESKTAAPVIAEHDSAESVKQETHEVHVVPVDVNKSPVPVFFVDWDKVKFDFDLNLYNDGDIIGYDKDGVEHKVGKMKRDDKTLPPLTYVTQTGVALFGRNEVPGDIYKQIMEWRDGGVTDEQVRDNYLDYLARYETAKKEVVTPETTPSKPNFLNEYERIKQQSGGAIVMYQIGGFYELFGDDAQLSSKVFGFTPTSRNGVSMCGFPVDKLDENVKKLVNEGFAVAVSSIKENGERSVILHDGGEPIEVKPVENLINRYEEKSTYITQISDMLGVDTKLLQELMQSEFSQLHQLNEYGRFDKLIDTVDKDKARVFFERVMGKELSVFNVNMQIRSLLNDFVTNGAFDIEKEWGERSKSDNYEEKSKNRAAQSAAEASSEILKPNDLNNLVSGDVVEYNGERWFVFSASDNGFQFNNANSTSPNMMIGEDNPHWRIQYADKMRIVFTGEESKQLQYGLIKGDIIDFDNERWRVEDIKTGITYHGVELVNTDPNATRQNLSISIGELKNGYKLVLDNAETSVPEQADEHNELEDVLATAFGEETAQKLRKAFYESKQSGYDNEKEGSSLFKQRRINRALFGVLENKEDVEKAYVILAEDDRKFKEWEAEIDEHNDGVMAEKSPAPTIPKEITEVAEQSPNIIIGGSPPLQEEQRSEPKQPASPPYELKEGDIIDFEGKRWRVDKIDGDFSIKLENANPAENYAERIFYGNWKEELVGYTLVTEQQKKPDTPKTEEKPPEKQGFGWHREVTELGSLEKAAKAAQNSVKPHKPIEPSEQKSITPAVEAGLDRTRAKKLYEQFAEMFPQIVSGEYDSMRFDGNGNDINPLNVENEGGGYYLFTEWYIDDGVIMSDPQFAFSLDKERKTLDIYYYEKDIIPRKEAIKEQINKGNVSDQNLLAKLEENLIQVLKNAKEAQRELIGYTPAIGDAVDFKKPQLKRKSENITESQAAAEIPDNTPDMELPEIAYAKNPEQKFQDNMEALRELKRLEGIIEENENNNDSEDLEDLYDDYDTKEKSDKKLAKYSGWGGLPQVFDEKNRTWEYQRNRLKELLTPEEYKAARKTTLNAHYTPQVIIDAMYQAVKNMELPRNARILEPSCGTGNFIRRMPTALKETDVTGVEIDGITAGIAKHLNPNARIIHSGFEHSKLDNDSFDLAIGNIPFGDYNLNDPDYVKDWRIHDAFFRKALDKVAAGGVVAFVTSSGTMDKANPKIREYLSTQAELVGAIRLPNNAFSSAGTKVTADIVFLQKRKTPLLPYEKNPDWCYTTPNADGLNINSYFVENPQMVLGKMEQTTHFNMLTCKPFEGADLKEQLDTAIKNLNAKITVDKREKAAKERAGVIQADSSVKNFTYTKHTDGKFYFRTGDTMKEVNLTSKQLKQLEYLCVLRDETRKLLDMQKEPIPDGELMPIRAALSDLYDRYKEQYGDLHSKPTMKIFYDDTDFELLKGLEVWNETKEEYEKAEIFFKRTVNPIIEITSAETIEEALQISLDRRGKPDMAYMALLLQREAEDVCNELIGKELVFRDPNKQILGKPYSGIVERSEYLSGNVRQKLASAQESLQTNSEYERNITALEKVIPEDIKAENISVRMGVPWIDNEDYTAFLQHLSKCTSTASKGKVTYFPKTAEFEVTGAKLRNKSSLNINENTKYGTDDFSVYALAEKILNQRQIVVKREVPNPQDRSKTITQTDSKATKKAHEKARIIKEEFKKWIFADTDRREKYEKKYNETFNCLVGREYDGSNLTFPGMNANFKMRDHQKNAIARTSMGGNTLAAHVVGAGKTAVIIATVMRKKELGLINKACVVVPKPLTEQIASDWRKLYPDSRVLTVTNNDLSDEKKRKIFTARIATGTYDAVIVSREQFEKIPMSKEYRIEFIQNQLDELEDMIRDRMESEHDRDPTTKNLELARERLETKLGKLTDSKSASRAKDDLLTFEELGFDYLAVDEAHSYKNGFIVTKMTNVAGVTTRESGRATDMQMKTDFLNDKLGNGHILMATGTPVSNSMTELYVMTRYLRPDLLEQAGISRFDEWAATFGNVTTQLEQTAYDTYKLKTRFSQFTNLPELMAFYKEFADIKSAKHLDLPRPALKNGKNTIVVVPATPEQKAYVKELGERAKAINEGKVKPKKDNFLKITGEARLIGLGNEVVKSLYARNGKPLPPEFVAEDEKNGKVNACVDKVFEKWEETKENKGVQLIFSDVAVNSDNGNFSAYEYIREELIAKGIPEDEIIFAPKSDCKDRTDIFNRINAGEHRVIIASTETLGTGVNIQKKLAALHHLDIPWKPSCLEQREGRILRYGNENKEVEIFNYVTKGTLDSYLYSTVTNKARFIAQILDNESPARVCADVDEHVLNFAEIQAAATGNPHIKKRIETANILAELQMLKREWGNEKARLRVCLEVYPAELEKQKETLLNVKADRENSKNIAEFPFENKQIQEKIILALDNYNNGKIEPVSIGKVAGFEILVEAYEVSKFLSLENITGETSARFVVKGEGTYFCEAGLGINDNNVTRLKNIFLNVLPKREEDTQNEVTRLSENIEQARSQIDTPFEHEERIPELEKELARLDDLLSGVTEQQDEVHDPEEDDLTENAVKESQNDKKNNTADSNSQAVQKPQKPNNQPPIKRK